MHGRLLVSCTSCQPASEYRYIDGQCGEAIHISVWCCPYCALLEFSMLCALWYIWSVSSCWCRWQHPVMSCMSSVHHIFVVLAGGTGILDVTLQGKEMDPSWRSSSFTALRVRKSTAGERFLYALSAPELICCTRECAPRATNWGLSAPSQELATKQLAGLNCPHRTFRSSKIYTSH